MKTITKAALKYAGAGISVLKTNRDKIPTKPWRDRQERIPSDDEVMAEFNGDKNACVALVCGQVSGNLETLDFDERAELYTPWAKLVADQCPGLLERLPMQSTQHNGRHVAYRCPGVTIPGNQKLAERLIDGKPKALIETRGEGGYFLVAPSHGYNLLQNRFSDPPEVTPGERQAMIACAGALTEHIRPEHKKTYSRPAYDGSTRPGDDYNARGNIAALLVQHGWQATGYKTTVNNSPGEWWRRPGKEGRGHSATLIDGKVLYVFSVNAAPFEPRTAYDPFAIYTMLEHAGDFSAAARALSGQGYGAQQQARGPRAEHTPWEDPILFDASDLPPISPEMMPGVISDFCFSIAQATETPPELAVMLGLATVATGCHGRIIARVRQDYFEPLNIWTIVALESGSRKSAVQRELTTPLSEWEKEKTEEAIPIQEDIFNRRKNIESRIKQLRRKYAKADDPKERQEIEAEIIGAESEMPENEPLPRTWTQDITPEHLAVLMAAQGGRMAILSSEGGIFDTMAGRYSSGIPNLDIFLQGYSGDSVRVDRGSRDPVFIPHPALTLGLSPQPEVIKALSKKEGFRGRGLLARPLYAVPKSNLGYRNLEGGTIDRVAKDRFYKMIRALLAVKMTVDGKARIIRLPDHVLEMWVEFAREVEVEMREGGRFEHLHDWAGKLPGQAVRLAGLFHCARYADDAPSTHPLDEDSMGMALSMASVLSHHALEVFDLIGQDPDVECAKKILEWITGNDLRVFTQRDCHVRFKGSYPKISDLKPGLDILTERQIIREKINKKEGAGRPSVAFEVNPKI